MPAGLSALFPAALALLLAACAARPAPERLEASEVRRASSVGQHDVFELSVRHNGVYGNNFFDVALEAVFTSPAGATHRAKGFYYAGDRWNVRFRPDTPGRWSYFYVLESKDGFRHKGTGGFDCTPSNDPGSVRRDPANPYRWVFANGTAYFPVGLQDCSGATLEDTQIDGERRGDKTRMVSRDEYFQIYGRAGFNLLRFSQRNCSYVLFDDLDHYRVGESVATDRQLELARRQGFRVMFGFFGSYGAYQPGSRPLRVLKRWLVKEGIADPGDRKTIAKEKRFVDYAVARWGVYTDFWELLNERYASAEWVSEMADYVHSIDPARRPVGTSWEHTHLPAIDIDTPHWYALEDEHQSDLRVVERANQWKKAGKPVIIGEQGNTGMNWDPRSAVRMRIRAWTAMFQEISLVFWNTSWSKYGMYQGKFTPGSAANIYLGPEERGFIRVLQDFSSRLDAGMRMTPVELSASGVRAYGLVSSGVAAVYLHHYSDHKNPVTGLKVRIPLPSAKLEAEWIDPGTGRTLKRTHAHDAWLEAPPFTLDQAVLVARGAARR